MQREPNTEYVLSLSYGKDSIACLEAIKQLGYPLDRIVHAEVWATDTIPADLPPMVKFKEYADKIIEERYGIKVEHIYAVRAGGEKLTYECQFYEWINKGKNKNRIYGFPYTLGAWCNSRLKVNALSAIGRKTNIRKVILPHTETQGERENQRDGWQRHGAGCGANSQLKLAALKTINSRIPNSKRNLVQQQSQTCSLTGFQSQSGEKKQRVFRKARLHNGQENKYCAIPRNSSR